MEKVLVVVSNILTESALKGVKYTLVPIRAAPANFWLVDELRYGEENEESVLVIVSKLPTQGALKGARYIVSPTDAIPMNLLDVLIASSLKAGE